MIFQKANNNGADQTVPMCRLVCACVVRIPPPPMEVASVRQVISHDSSVTSMVLMVLNGRKCITYIYYIIKTIVGLCYSRHGVILNSKLNHMTFTVQ